MLLGIRNKCRSFGFLRCSPVAQDDRLSLTVESQVFRRGGRDLGHPALSAMKSALAGIGEGAKDGAGVVVHHLAKVHSDGKDDNQEEKVDAKQ